ncbi:MAG: pyridine nucleotide-disulfide oxidoreductase [Microbacterium sp.]|nr:pyridine nucleotide-disulfide oxidoreductase [Microbacterium sp.]
MSERTYDLVVIGAGPVGENVADRAVQGGLSVAIVESELVGGECSYWACMPSKGLLRAGAALRAARAVDGAKQAVTGDVDVAGVLRRRDSLTSDWNDSSQVEWLQGAGVDLVRGHGRLAGEKRVEVTEPDGSVTTLVARHAVAVCTGSAALLPDVPGLADVSPWTSREATAVQEVPGSLAIVGGGVVAAEMATAFVDLGSDVLELSNGTRVRADEVLVATGRVPRTGDLGLDAVGLEPDSWMDVDDTMLVRGSDWLYAVGDVNRRALLTHQGKYQARAAGDVIVARATGGTVDDAPWGAHVATADHAAVPQVTFTDPEVASIGETEASARAAGRNIRVLDYDLSWIAGASTRSDAYTGQARAIVDEDRGVLIGATFVGADVGELLVPDAQRGLVALPRDVRPPDRLSPRGEPGYRSPGAPLTRPVSPSAGSTPTGRTASSSARAARRRRGHRPAARSRRSAAALGGAASRGSG